jgi:hypothetical protein
MFRNPLPAFDVPTYLIHIDRGANMIYHDQALTNAICFDASQTSINPQDICSQLPKLMPVGTLQDGYVRNVPLPRVPREQRASHEPTAPKGIQLPGYSSLPAWIPTLPRIGNALGFSQRIL